jgi:hypothetical protein
MYILIDHEGTDYLQPVNGNSLWPVSLWSLIVNEMWLSPPIIVLMVQQKDT